MLSKTHRDRYYLSLNFTYWKLTRGEIKSFKITLLEGADEGFVSLSDFKDHGETCRFGVSLCKTISTEAVEFRHCPAPTPQKFRSIYNLEGDSIWAS